MAMQVRRACPTIHLGLAMSTLVTLTLFVVGANSQCSIGASGATASAFGAAVQGSTAAVAYAFSGETTAVNGLMCAGCAKYTSGEIAGTAGTWYSTSDVSSGANASSAGFLCPSDGSSCSSVLSGEKASAAGKFYLSRTISSGTTANATGVLCPSSDQETSSGNTCAVVNTGMVSPATSCLGAACQGSTGICAAVIKGYTASSNGLYCPGCAFKKSGTTAEISGAWWVIRNITSGTQAFAKGIFCPSMSTSPCALITAGEAASSDGKYYYSSSVTPGDVALEDGVLCQSNSASRIAIPLFTILLSFYVHCCK